MLGDGDPHQPRTVDRKQEINPNMVRGPQVEFLLRGCKIRTREVPAGFCRPRWKFPKRKGSDRAVSEE